MKSIPITAAAGVLALYPAAEISWGQVGLHVRQQFLLLLLKKEILFILILSVLWILEFPLAHAQLQEETIIAYAQNIQVSNLDSTLPKQPIEVWLTSLVGSKTTISWEVNDCGEQTGVAGDSSSINPPVCSQVTSKLENGRTVGIQIIVGTFKEGIKGTIKADCEKCRQRRIGCCIRSGKIRTEQRL